MFVKLTIKTFKKTQPSPTCFSYFLFVLDKVAV